MLAYMSLETSLSLPFLPIEVIIPKKLEKNRDIISQFNWTLINDTLTI